jgi:hypothetical protein
MRSLLEMPASTPCFEKPRPGALGNNDPTTAIARLNDEITDATNAKSDCPGIFLSSLTNVISGLTSSIGYLNDISAVHPNASEEDDEEYAYESKIICERAYGAIEDDYYN